MPKPVSDLWSDTGERASRTLHGTTMNIEEEMYDGARHRSHGGRGNHEMREIYHYNVHLVLLQSRALQQRVIGLQMNRTMAGLYICYTIGNKNHMYKLFVSSCYLLAALHNHFVSFSTRN